MKTGVLKTQERIFKDERFLIMEKRFQKYDRNAKERREKVKGKKGL